MSNWSRNFAAFAKAHGRTPEQQIRFDEDKWPGGRMTGFQLWISQQLREAHEAGQPCVVRDLNGLHTRAGWVEWLERPGASRIPDDPAVDTESKPAGAS